METGTKKVRAKALTEGMTIDGDAITAVSITTERVARTDGDTFQTTVAVEFADGFAHYQPNQWVEVAR